MQIYILALQKRLNRLAQVEKGIEKLNEVLSDVFWSLYLSETCNRSGSDHKTVEGPRWWLTYSGWILGCLAVVMPVLLLGGVLDTIWIFGVLKKIPHPTHPKQKIFSFSLCQKGHDARHCNTVLWNKLSFGKKHLNIGLPKLVSKVFCSSIMVLKCRIRQVRNVSQTARFLILFRHWHARQGSPNASAMAVSSWNCGPNVRTMPGSLLHKAKN